MSKYVSIKDADGGDFAHNFSGADWDALCSLCGRRNGSVELSEGSATIDGGTVFVTLQSPGGRRHYALPADALYQ